MERVLVHNGDVTLSVLVAGEGPTLVLLHGWPDTSALWDDVAVELLAAGYRVVVPDLRGCGQSSKPTETSQYAMRLLVHDVLCVIDAVGADRVTLVGHDWGANLAWVCAAYLPQRVERLVVLSAVSYTHLRAHETVLD